MKTLVNLVIMFLDWFYGVKSRLFGAGREVAAAAAVDLVASGDIEADEVDKELWNERFKRLIWRRVSVILRGSRIKMLPNGEMPKEEIDEVRAIFKKMDREIERPKKTTAKERMDILARLGMVNQWFAIQKSFSVIVSEGYMNDVLYVKIIKILRKFRHTFEELEEANRRVNDELIKSRDHKKAVKEAVIQARIDARHEFCLKVEQAVARACTVAAVLVLLSTGFAAGRFTAYATAPNPPTTTAPAVTTPATMAIITPTPTPAPVVEEPAEEEIGGGHATKEDFEKIYQVPVAVVDGYTYKIGNHNINMPKWFGEAKDLFIAETKTEVNRDFPNGIAHVIVINAHRDLVFDVQVANNGTIYRIDHRMFNQSEFPNLVGLNR